MFWAKTSKKLMQRFSTKIPNCKKNVGKDIIERAILYLVLYCSYIILMFKYLHFTNFHYVTLRVQKMRTMQ